MPAIAAAVVLLAAAPAAVESARWNWSGSGTLDYLRLYPAHGAGDLTLRGANVEWSVKAAVEVSEKTSIAVRLCTTCHGLTVDQAYAEIRLAPHANLQAGRIAVPFGDFYQRYDPASEAFLSKPLPYAMGHMLRFQATQFNLGVVPMPYVDQGAAFFGDVWFHDALQVWYALYGVNGFRSDSPQDFAFKDQLADRGFNDNNGDVSVGGRLALAQGPFAAGGSYLRGAYDPRSRFAYGVWGVDGAVRLPGGQLRGEYVSRSTEVLAAGARSTLRKQGFYAQVEAPVRGPLAIVARFDGLLREGPPLGTDNDEASGIVRWTIGANVSPTIDYAFRVQYEHWRFTDFADRDALHVGMVVSY
jgi:hypothetical protein